VPRRIALSEGGERSAALVGQDEGGRVRFARESAGPAAPSWVDVTSAFGFTPDRRFQRPCAAIYRVYPFPLLRVRMYATDDGWRVGQLQPVSLPQASAAEVALLAERLGRGPAALAAVAPPPPRRHRLAVLFDPADPTTPSDEGTIDKLARIAARRGLLVERIGKGDLARLGEYDALFIRTVTAINNVSFLFSQTAESYGMPVIDDPASIIKCSNKIFLYEVFRKQGLPMPDTAVLSPKNWREEVRPLGLPVILKVPDGTFSLAVKRAADEGELETLTRELFRRTPLLLAQRFTPSTFDWRVGILEGKILWTARYHMAPGHWQIALRSARGTRYGKVDAVPAEECPAAVRELALAGTALIGDGLYGVDIKETESGPVLIEINDNPNLESGIEDAAEKDRPYEALVDCFLRRIEAEGRVDDPAAAGNGRAAAPAPNP
jgi:glutathione synthase/RimK-type ligase-like ATP-grasp enzyme